MFGMKSLVNNLKDARKNYPFIIRDVSNYAEQHYANSGCEIKGFLSYNHEDSKKAALVKNLLQVLGINAFMAHEDIMPSSEWDNLIIKELKECNLFFPVITKNFFKSDWTNQECGAAIVRGITIMPISIALEGEELEMPRGFLARYQAMKYILRDYDKINANNVFGKPTKSNIELLERIVKAIKDKPEVISKVRNCFVKSFVDSNSFNESNLKENVLRILEPFDETQLTMLVLGYAFNDQINNAYPASKSIEKLIQNNFDRLDYVAKSIWEASKSKDKIR